MTHSEDKKAAKKGSKQPKSPEVIHVDEQKKHSSKGLIKGTE